MENIKKNQVFTILTVAIVIVSLALSFVFKSNAGSLTAVYFYMSRMKANITGSGSDTVEYVLAFAPTQAIPTGGTVTITFPAADNGMWCRTPAGALTVTGITTSAASDLTGTNWQIDAALPTSGTLAATCSQGSGGTVDTITITSVGALAAGQTYGVRISNGTGRIGTDDTTGTHNITVEAKNGTTIDSSTFGVQLIENDQVSITATVESTPSVTCSISTNSVNLGALYPGGSYSTGSHTISANTSATAKGYYWSVYGQGNGSTDAGLWKSDATTYLIPSAGSGTIDLREVGAEGFGLVASDPDGAGAAVVATDFSNGTAGIFGALDRGVSGAQLLLTKNIAQTSSETSTITYGAKAGTTAQAGAYQETVTFVCGGYY